MSTPVNDAGRGAAAEERRARGMFRPEAVEQASVGQRLDGLVRVTPLSWWLALVVVGLLLAATVVWGVLGRAPTLVSGPGLLLGPTGLDEVDAATAGTVVALHVAAGDHLRPGEAVATIEPARGAPVVVRSRTEGDVLLVAVFPGDVVQPGRGLVEVLPQGSESQAQIFVPTATGTAVRPGMRVQVNPASAPAAQYGSIVGTVRAVSRAPLSSEALGALVGGNDALVRTIQPEGGSTVLQVEVTLALDPSTPSGYRWTSGRGPGTRIPPATLLTADVVVAERRPLQLVGEGHDRG